MLHIGLVYKFNMEKRYYSNIPIYGLVDQKAVVSLNSHMGGVGRIESALGKMLALPALLSSLLAAFLGYLNQKKRNCR